MRSASHRDETVDRRLNPILRLRIPPGISHPKNAPTQRPIMFLMFGLRLGFPWDCGVSGFPGFSIATFPYASRVRVRVRVRVRARARARVYDLADASGS